MRYYNPGIKALSSLYDLLSANVNGFPDKDFDDYSKKQRQYIISNLITFSDENSAILSDEMNEALYPYPELSFDRLREILKSANTEYTESVTARHNEWIAFAQHFDKLTEHAFVRAIDDSLFDTTFLYAGPEENVSFLPESTSSYRQIIYLENPVFSDNFDPDVYETSDAEIDMLDSGYRLSFVQANQMITVDFSGIQLKTQLFNYSASTTGDGSPWSRISESLTSLGNKKDILGREFLNQKEEALWQLGEFSPIHSIHSNYQSDSGDKQADELFINFARRAGNDRIAEMTQRYADTSFKEKEKARKALITELKKPSSEALARIILAEIKDAASEYVTEVERYTVPEVLEQTRKTITDIMKQKGYDGEYPHFRKMSSLKGVRLLEMEGQPVLVSNEKNMACMVGCSENCLNFNTLGINFTVSTVFLKKEERHRYDTLDEYSGFFPHKHRRRARSTSPNLDFRDDGELTYDLEGVTIAAAKTAACEKLTKEERKTIVSVGPGLYGCLFYGGFFLLTGLLFGSMMCPGMFLVCLIIGAPFTIFSSEIPFVEFIRFLIFGLPWGWMFLFCVVGFGLPMTILTALSKRRG